uniref:uncharacterized protein LOC122583915 n=1 Tax=Erigeron canadensis TaxID=72917 RepID=UPI001CB93CFC|nr:uncharacterized protein LOC122583915 [Erigeron canadensis]
MSIPIELAHLQIPLEEILKATNNFADQNIIGLGGFGRVYKGKLFWQGHLIKIAAKRLDRSRSGGDIEFWTDISTLYSLRHRNVVSIVGFCDENHERIIISKYEIHGSLDKYLNETSTLTWSQRLRICVDVAHALSYIHYDERRDFSVIHRNIKSSKILLDDNWEPKITGFNLSLKVPASRRNRLHLSSPCGTPGYVDPTYYKTGRVTHKSDLYSFGLLLFEVMCNKRTRIADMDEDHRHLGSIARSHYEKGKLDEIIDPGIRKQMDRESLNNFSETAYHCLKMRRAERPNIDQIVLRLQKALELQLKSENLEHSTVNTEVEGTSPDSQKWKHLEHLRIGLDDIKAATCNFAETYRIGSGGYGMVYRAELEHFDNVNSMAVEGNINCELPKKRSLVAIKRILNREDKQGEQGFIAEVETLTGCKHRNIISLLGFCDESSEMILIYEHAFNGSLDDYLGNIANMTNLIWAKRLQMCLDIAQGLNYLHTKDVQRIIHRDIKSDNILLDHNWVAKIADFGLSKFGPGSQQVSYLETNVAGTNVYIDPEYMVTRKLKIATDIYSFGVVLFEILSGKLAYDPFYIQKNDKGLAPIARQHFVMGTLMEMVDPKIKEEVDENTFTLTKGPNQDSLDTFFKIAYQCLAETQAQRPTMKTVIMELEKALDFQENRKDNLQISLLDIKLATQDFSPNKLIGKRVFGEVYFGEIEHANGRTSFVAKRLNRHFDFQFFIELEILFEYKHQNIIGLVGYVNEAGEKIILYEHDFAPDGSLDMHVKDVSLTWTKRLKIGIDVANGLNFLHGGVVTQDVVIHKDIQSGNILLNGKGKALIANFGVAIIMPKSKEIDFVVENASGSMGYIDPLYLQKGFLSRESDIYSFGIVLFELLCGRMACVPGFPPSYLSSLVISHYKEGKLDELVFEGLREQVVPKSLLTFQKIAYQCLHKNREERPTAKQVSVQLKKALEFQEDHEIWEPKLPRDYLEIIQLSKTPDVFYSVEKKKDLYDMLSKGILIQDGIVWFSLSNNGDKNEMISARMFSYENPTSLKWKSLKNSRFPVVVKMKNISDLQIKINIKPQFLSPSVIYGAYLIFKFCDPRKSSNQPVYVNLKLKMGSKTLYAYFARWREDGWMMTELWRFLHYKDNAVFEVILESFSRYYCGSGAIYVEGIEFRAIHDSSLNQLTVDSSIRTKHEQGEKFMTSKTDEIRLQTLYVFKNKQHLSKPEENKSLMFPASMVLDDSFNVQSINWRSLTESRFVDVAELLSHQEFRIRCKIETQKLSPDTDYACHLIFKLSQKCHGLHCPVKVQDVLVRKNKESKFLYFRMPSPINLHPTIRVPKLREYGLMEVILWEFNSSKKLIDDHRLMHLKLRCYEGTMCGLIVCGVDFRPI